MQLQDMLYSQGFGIRRVCSGLVQQGWVEHNPMEIWSTQYGVMNEVVAQSGVDAHDIAAIGITNQRETTILWEKGHRPPHL